MGCQNGSQKLTWMNDSNNLSMKMLNPDRILVPKCLTKGQLFRSNDQIVVKMMSCDDEGRVDDYKDGMYGLSLSGNPV